MLRKNCAITGLLVLCLYAVAWGNTDILVLQSVPVKPYQLALDGFGKTCPGALHSFILSEEKNIDVWKQIRRIDPSLILAIGTEALWRLKDVTDIPVVYAMVLNPDAIVGDRKNVAGVCMHVDPRIQLDSMRRAIPTAGSIGLVYDPLKSDVVVAEATRAARALNVNLVAKPVTDSRQAPSAVNSIRESIDVYWLLPDETIVQPEALESVFLTMIEGKIPVVAFSEKYFELGAMMSIAIDPFDIGMQAGEIARAVIEGRSPEKGLRQFARKEVLSINRKVAEKLGVVIPESMGRFGDERE